MGLVVLIYRGVVEQELELYVCALKSGGRFYQEPWCILRPFGLRVAFALLVCEMGLRCFNHAFFDFLFGKKRAPGRRVRLALKAPSPSFNYMIMNC